MKVIKSVLLSLTFLISWSVVVAEIEIPDAPNPPRLVNDYAKILSPEEQQLLEQKLVAYDDSTSKIGRAHV